MTTKVSTNLNRRIQLLREQRNELLVYVGNNKKIPQRLYEDYNHDLKICKQILKKELLKAPVNNIL